MPCFVCTVPLLLMVTMPIVINVLGRLTSVRIHVVIFTCMILNAQNKQMDRDYNSPFLQVEKMKEVIRLKKITLLKVEEL